jgi:predicted membrane protein
MKKILLFSAILFSFIYLFAQNKKEVKKNKIKTVTVTETAAGKTLNDEKTVFDKNGEVIEETSYTKEGAIKNTHKYKRNKAGDVVEET